MVGVADDSCGEEVEVRLAGEGGGDGDVEGWIGESPRVAFEGDYF